MELQLVHSNPALHPTGPPCSWLYHLDVMAYLTDVLRQLPAILPTDSAAIRPLLPDRWAQAHPDHIHASRDEELRADTARRNKCRAKRRQTVAK
jgi:hypothetical protein